MRLETIKNPERTVALKGIDIDWLVEDGGVRSITLIDEDGETINIAIANTYSNSLRFAAPVKPKRVEKFRLIGEAYGAKIDSLFGTSEMAERAKDRISSGDYSSSVDLRIERVFVLLDDDDNVVGDPEIEF